MELSAWWWEAHQRQTWDEGARVLAIPRTTGLTLGHTATTASIVVKYSAPRPAMQGAFAWTANACADSGAAASLVSKKLVKMLQVRLERSQSGDLFTASGERMEILGDAVIPFQLENGCKLEWRCIVANKFTHGLLLGTDFSEHTGLRFRFRTIHCG